MQISSRKAACAVSRYAHRGPCSS